MPNLPAHLHLAHQAASQLGHPVVDRHRGPFLLGSTTPDIRAMTKWPRDQTHFAPLSVDRVGAGVDGMFRAHPYLLHSSLSAPTRAFVAGYINHIVADESWILSVYAPCFSNQDGPDSQMQSNLWDRAIQLDMDREARAAMDDMLEVRSLLDGADEDVEVGFIEGDTLSRWCDWVKEFNSWEFTWERLQRAMRRMYGDDEDAARMTQLFIEDMPQSLEYVYSVVSPEGLALYREGTVKASIKLMKEYLDAPAGDRWAGGS